MHQFVGATNLQEPTAGACAGALLMLQRLRLHADGLAIGGSFVLHCDVWPFCVPAGRGPACADKR